jgi:hypothetical protein
MHPNDRLFAAAPELLMVCRQMLVALRLLDVEPIDHDGWSICEQAEQAVAKATGITPRQVRDEIGDGARRLSGEERPALSTPTKSGDEPVLPIVADA